MKDFKRIATYKNLVGELTVTYKRTEQVAQKIFSSKSVFEIATPYFDECMDDHEEFKVLHLNNQNQVVNVHHASTGSDTGTVVDVKAIVRNVLQINCNSVILLHNHPSGNINASDADKIMTKKLQKALGYFDIKVLDHVILTRYAYKSFADDGLL